jgi:hypothetical protein
VQRIYDETASVTDEQLQVPQVHIGWRRVSHKYTSNGEGSRVHVETFMTKRMVTI